MRGLDGGQLSSLSDAEWVAYYLRNLKADKEYLDQLNAFLQGPGNLFIRAESAFDSINERYRTLEAELADGRAKGHVDRDVRIGAELEELRPVRDLFKKRFDLAIERHRLIRQLIPVVQRRIGQIEETLARTMGEVERPPNSATPDGPPAPTAAAVPAPGRPPEVPGFPPGVLSPKVVPPPSPAGEAPEEAAERQKTPRISRESCPGTGGGRQVGVDPRRAPEEPPPARRPFGNGRRGDGTGAGPPGERSSPARQC